MQENGSDNADVIALPPVLYAAALATGLVLHFVFPIQLLPQMLSLSLGIALILVSIVIVVSALRALARAKTTFDTRKATTAIVTDGPFRYSRSPMYLALTFPAPMRAQIEIPVHADCAYPVLRSTTSSVGPGGSVCHPFSAARRARLSAGQ